MTKKIEGDSITNNKPEVWKDIPEYEGYYQVSNYGNIRSLDRWIDFYNRHDGSRRPMLRPGTMMKGGSTPNGYSIVALTKLGKRKDKSIHRIVAQVFLPQAHTTEQINHKDGNKKNNVVTNLEWCTASENQRHAIQIGLIVHTKKSV